MTLMTLMTLMSGLSLPTVTLEIFKSTFKILQVENASLSDLTAVFLATLEGFAVPAGTIVLISSVSHLVAVGAAAYAEDLVRAYRAVRAVYGNARYPLPAEWSAQPQHHQSTAGD